MKKFAYIFSLGSKITWSGDTEEMIIQRIRKEPLKIQNNVKHFLANSQVGNFYILEPYGEMIFRIQ